MYFEKIDFTRKFTKKRLEVFADELKQIDYQVGMKLSSRGWCYQLENYRVVNKDQFDKVENMINRCRKIGLLPIDFIAEEEGSRSFSGVETPDTGHPVQQLKWWLRGMDFYIDNYSPDWFQYKTIISKW